MSIKHDREIPKDSRGKEIWGNLAKEEDEDNEKKRKESESEDEEEKVKSNFGLSGALAKDAETGSTNSFCSLRIQLFALILPNVIYAWSHFIYSRI